MMLAAYRTEIEQRRLRPDPAQAAAAEKLAALARALKDYRPGGFSFFRKAAPPRGLYIWGDVGRGKSMLMDLFFASAPIEPKRRIHFNAFMTDVHARIHAARARADVSDPIPPVGRAIANEARLLCFDEFQVTDVADAMILGRLFEQLFAAGTVIVATSNTEPRRLYEGGLNRQLFLPFIAEIEAKLEVVTLNGATDYRQGLGRDAETYFMPLSPAADAAMDAVFARATGGARGKTVILSVLGRSLIVPLAAGDVARFDFAELCERPLGAADYLAIARRFRTVLVDHVPVMGETLQNAARRFVLLVDTLYDEGVRLVLSAAAPAEALCPAGPVAEAFRRTASRLAEMRSEDYLSRHDPGTGSLPPPAQP